MISTKEISSKLGKDPVGVKAIKPAKKAESQVDDPKVKEAYDEGVADFKRGIPAGLRPLQWFPKYTGAWKAGWDAAAREHEEQNKTVKKAEPEAAVVPTPLRTIDYSDAQLTPLEEVEISDTVTDLRAAVKIVDAQASVLKHGMERKSQFLNKSRLMQASRLARQALDTVDSAIARIPFTALCPFILAALLCLQGCCGCSHDKQDKPAPQAAPVAHVNGCQDGHCDAR